MMSAKSICYHLLSIYQWSKIHLIWSAIQFDFYPNITEQFKDHILKKTNTIFVYHFVPSITSFLDSNCNHDSSFVSSLLYQRGPVLKTWIHFH